MKRLMKSIIENNVAFIIKNIKNISGECPGKKTLQKLTFLIEQKGIDLGCKYGLHFYGPYSSVLDNAVFELSTEGIINFDYSGYSHRMDIDSGYEIKSKVSDKEEKIMIDVLEQYKDWSPSRLELLTTAIYAYDNLTDKSKESVIGGVIKIKGNKYSQQEIEDALKEFPNFNKRMQ